MRHPLLCLLGLVCVMALALATPDANALTPLGKTADQTATLAIQPAPTMDIITPTANCDLFGQPTLSASTATLPETRTDNPVAWRSMPLKISVMAAMNPLCSPTKIDVNPVATARAAPNIDGRALAHFPNPFDDETKLVATLSSAETTLTATSALAATPGGQEHCRAVIAASLPKAAPQKKFA